MTSSPRDSALATSLRSAGFRGELQPEQPLAPCTTWRIGGPAELLASPVDAEDLRVAVGWAAGGGIPWRVMGNGSNLLIRDEGVRGLVLRVRRVLDDVRGEDDEVVAGAGASFPSVARWTASRGLAGLEFGAGIPGTVGGAIVMNAGWHEFETGNHVFGVSFLNDDGVIEERPHASCGFGYRTSAFRGRRGVVLSATFHLARGDAEEIGKRLEGFAASRKANQPTELPSCGSVFLKPPGDFAGRLIEEAGLKGLRVGGIEVSIKHANFFVNRGNGTAHDVLRLVERVEHEVERKLGVRLEREFEVW